MPQLGIFPPFSLILLISLSFSSDIEIALPLYMSLIFRLRMMIIFARADIGLKFVVL